MDLPGESGLNPEEPGMMVVELERLHPQSFGWALACCRGDRSEAEEVLQVAYMKILDGSARFGTRSRFKTRLFAVILLEREPVLPAIRIQTTPLALPLDCLLEPTSTIVVQTVPDFATGPEFAWGSVSKILPEGGNQ